MWSSFAYVEPSTSTTLILLSYLFLLNVFGWIAQRLVGAALIGQILIGIIYGTPLSGWLNDTIQAALVDVGYVGLLLVVFEGGLTTSPRMVLRLLGLSTLVALTGLLLPIALSFILIPLSGSSPLHAFAAGSALSSTSLGTVLTLLNPRVIGFDLRTTRVGIVLLSAAVLDDVVALVLVKILEVIGDAHGGVGQSIGRTLGVTVGLSLPTGLIARFGLLPLYSALQRRQDRWGDASWARQRLAIFCLGCWFIGMVAAAGYAGTSVLFGSYLAGLAVAYIIEQMEGNGNVAEAREPIGGDLAKDTPLGVATENQNARLRRVSTFPLDPSTPLGVIQGNSLSMTPKIEEKTPLMFAFEHYIVPVMDILLLPIFFGSIGYSIPFVPLWHGRIVWRGIIYALLMALGKMACGVWLLRLPDDSKTVARPRSLRWRGCAIVSVAMVARGEIGLLISQVARHTAEPLLDEDEFLQVTWAIVLCTIIGPIGTHLAVRRWAGLLREDSA